MQITGEDFWVARQGSGPALVMLHGGPGGYDQFDALASMLEPWCDVIRYDQRGCGRTRAKPRYDLVSALQDLESLRAACQVSSWCVLGHSFGCDLALLYAVAFPQRVTGLILIANYNAFGDERAIYVARRDARLGEQLQRYRELGAQLANRWDPQQARELSRLQARIDLDPRSPAELMPVYEFPINFDANRILAAEAKAELAKPAMRSAVAELAVPALVLHGQGDARPGSAGLSWCRERACRQGVMLEGAGHWPWLEQPAVAAAALATWITQQRSGAP